MSTRQEAIEAALRALVAEAEGSFFRVTGETLCEARAALAMAGAPTSCPTCWLPSTPLAGFCCRAAEAFDLRNHATAAEQHRVAHAKMDGWRTVAMHDPAGRRGLWYREHDGAIELCAGREGDDAFVRLALVGDDRKNLEDCLSRAAGAAEMLLAERPRDVAGEGK